GETPVLHRVVVRPGDRRAWSYAAGVDRHHLSLAKGTGLVCIERRLRPVGHQGLERYQEATSLAGRHRIERIEADRLRDAVAADAGASQRRQVPAATEGRAEVARERADVRSLAAGHA